MGMQQHGCLSSGMQIAAVWTVPGEKQDKDQEGQDTGEAQSQLGQCSTSGDVVPRLCLPWPHTPPAGHALPLPQMGSQGSQQRESLGGDAQRCHGFTIQAGSVRGGMFA